MMRIFVFLLFTLLLFSCSNLYYNRVETYHDKKEARTLINELKEGTLVIQIPCEGRKLEVMEKLAISEKNVDKQRLLFKDLEEYKSNLKRMQSAMMEAANKEYRFSKYIFLPDTAVTAFKAGKRDQIAIDSSFNYLDVQNIGEAELIMYVRGTRNHDFLYIFKENGKYPPEPFPYHSSMNPVFSPTNSFNQKNDKIFFNWRKLFHEAFANLNFKLSRFYSR